MKYIQKHTFYATNQVSIFRAKIRFFFWFLKKKNVGSGLILGSVGLRQYNNFFFLALLQRKLNPLNPTGRYIVAYANREPKNIRAGIPAFAMVCQKPQENVNRLT